MNELFDYQVVTAARDEEDYLPQLADALIAQTVRPSRWTIVDGGSSDSTVRTAAALASEHPWVEVVRLEGSGPAERGAPIVRAINAAIDRVEAQPDVFVNLDADVTMPPHYFERIGQLFAADPHLGIASGIAHELDAGEWRPRFVTGGTVWGAIRAYRWECLQAVLPLEPRHGWDGIDQLRARARGWTTWVDPALPFYHHRPEGARDGSRWAHWRVNGETAYFMGYRPTYLALRVAHRVMRRDPAAIGMITGFASAARRRAPQLGDADAVAVLRQDQRLRNVLTRRREANGMHGG